MSHDPYGDYFARDYMSAGDFSRAYGLLRPRSFRLLQFGLRDAFDQREKKKVPKPVMWLVEMRDLPIFTNKSQHEALLNRFGDLYWRSENRHKILYAPIQLQAYERRGGDGPQTVIEIVEPERPHADHREPIGAETADRIRAALAPLGFTRDRFRGWVQQNHRDTLTDLDATESLAELPRYYAQILAEWQREASSDISRKPEPAPKAQPAPKPAPKPKEDHGGHPSGFPGGSDYNITKDDIPF